MIYIFITKKKKYQYTLQNEFTVDWKRFQKNNNDFIVAPVNPFWGIITKYRNESLVSSQGF